jgi:RNA polymerase nonessential primary-like sigma factor
MVRPHTLQEIAEELGVSRERVRQIERQALAKVKAYLLRQGYEPDDLIDLRD